MRAFSSVVWLVRSVFFPFNGRQTMSTYFLSPPDYSAVKPIRRYFADRDRDLQQQLKRREFLVLEHLPAPTLAPD